LIEDISETSTTVSKYNDDMKKYLTIKFLQNDKNQNINLFDA